MLLRRRNTTSLTTLHPLTLHTRLESQGTKKTPYLRSDHSKKIHIQKSRKKKQALFLLNPFCNARGCVY
jgi:hypothetical protein